MIGRDVMRQNIDQSEVYQELEERLHEELDYINEAKNIALFQQMFRDDREVLIPAVYPEFSSRRVLTMSRLEGYPFADILKPGVDQATKDWVALKYFRVTWRQIFEFGTLHTDPHPGNYLVTYHPKLAILDFGSIRIFPEPIREAYHAPRRRHSARATSAAHGRVLRAASASSIAGDDPSADDQDHGRDLRAGAGRPEVRPARLRLARARHGDRAPSASSTACSKPRATASSSARALIGLDSYLKQLGTVTNWHRVFKECVEKYGK